jgi:hypothetical protein
MAQLTSEVATPVRKTLSGIPIEPFYGPEHVEGLERRRPPSFPTP